MQTMLRNTQDTVEGVMNLNDTVAPGPNPVSSLAAARDLWVTPIIPEFQMTGRYQLPLVRQELSYTEDIMTIGQGSTRHNDNCLSKHDVNQCLGFSLGYSPLYINLECPFIFR